MEPAPAEAKQRKPCIMDLPNSLLKQPAIAQLMALNKVPLILLYYGLCSSTLIVINKVAVHNLNAPVFILGLQLLFAAYTVKALALFGIIEVEHLQWRLIKPFVPVIVGFIGVVFSNMKVLVYSNVETFITFRSSTPFVLAVLEWMFLGRKLPGSRSILSIALLIVSCAGYTYYDQGFRLEAYTWLLIWYAFMAFEACYVKYHCDNVNMTNWGRVYYTNILAGLVMIAVFPFCKSEHAALRAIHFTKPQLLLLFLSCLMGTCMSHASYLMRSSVSATTGVVVGMVCKLLSVALNCLIWDQHATPIQLAFLMLGLLGGTMFQQQPMRKPSGLKLPLAVQDMTSKYVSPEDKLQL